MIPSLKTIPIQYDHGQQCSEKSRIIEVALYLKILKMAKVNIDTIEAHEAGALAEGTGFMYIPFVIRIF